MTKILVEIEPDGLSCGNCGFQSTYLGSPRCDIFGEELKRAINIMEYSAEEQREVPGDIIDRVYRCEDCLEAERKTKTFFTRSRA